MATFVPRFLRQLRDVLIASPADAEVLTYDIADGKWKNAAGGGGGLAAGTYVPVADSSGVIVDTTTYDNSVSGSGKMNTLVFPVDTAAIAIALDGDSFPRWVFAADAENGLFLGNGNQDPVEDGIEIDVVNTAGGLVAIGFGPPGASFVIGEVQTNRGGVVRSSKPFVLTNAGAISSEDGAPTFGGEVGDLYIRRDAASDSEILYRCNVAGASGAATWVAIAIASASLLNDHSARHENGGADEISVAGLSGLLADAQTPATHAHSGADITSGTVVDARIDAAIARDSEVTAAVAAEASARTTADGLLVAKSLYDANTVLAATTDDTPAALTVAASTFVGRKASGNIAAMTATEAKAVLAIAESDVTNLTTDLAAKVPKTLFDANTVLAADTDDTPAAVTMGASTILARLAAGNIKAATPAEIKTLLDLDFGAVRRRFRFYDDFLANTYVATSSMTQNASGGGAGIAAVVGTTNHPGIWTLETGTATTGRGFYSSNDIEIGGGAITFECAAKILNVADGTEIYTATIGFHDVTTISPVDGISFRYDLSGLGAGSAASANWQCITSSNSARTYTTTATAVSAGTWAVFRIEINAAGTSVTFYINGVSVATHTTNIPTGSSRTTPWALMMLKSAGTTNRVMHFDYIEVEQDFTVARG